MYMCVCICNTHIYVLLDIFYNALFCPLWIFSFSLFICVFALKFGSILGQSFISVMWFSVDLVSSIYFVCIFLSSTILVWQIVFFFSPATTPIASSPTPLRYSLFTSNPLALLYRNLYMLLLILLLYLLPINTCLLYLLIRWGKANTY